MKFDKKVIITIVSTVVGVILLWGIISFAAHGRYEGRNFGRSLGNPGCNSSFAKGNQTQMMSGIKNIIATKDYAAFQTLFSGSRMLQEINTPEKFATRVELQTTIQKSQELQTQLWSGNKNSFGPMMFDNMCGQAWRKNWVWMMGRENGRWNMMQRR